MNGHEDMMPLSRPRSLAQRDPEAVPATQGQIDAVVRALRDLQVKEMKEAYAGFRPKAMMSAGDVGFGGMKEGIERFGATFSRVANGMHASSEARQESILACLQEEFRGPSRATRLQLFAPVPRSKVHFRVVSLKDCVPVLETRPFPSVAVVSKGMFAELQAGGDRAFAEIVDEACNAEKSGRRCLRMIDEEIARAPLAVRRFLSRHVGLVIGLARRRVRAWIVKVLALLAFWDTRAIRREARRTITERPDGREYLKNVLRETELPHVAPPEFIAGEVSRRGPPSTYVSVSCGLADPVSVHETESLLT